MIERRGLIEQAAVPMPPFVVELREKIRAGEKTQTRRVMKPQPPKGWDVGVLGNGFAFYHRRGDGAWEDQGKFMSPYGQAGQVRYLREPLVKDERGFARYADDGALALDSRGDVVVWRWRLARLPQIYMPREMARSFVRLGDVRGERLQEISEADAVAEGVAPNWRGPLDGWSAHEHGYMDYSLRDDWDGEGGVFLSAVQSYKTLWDKLNAKRGHGWDVNDWVWVLGFGLVGGEQ